MQFHCRSVLHLASLSRKSKITTSAQPKIVERTIRESSSVTGATDLFPRPPYRLDSVAAAEPYTSVSLWQNVTLFHRYLNIHEAVHSIDRNRCFTFISCLSSRWKKTFSIRNAFGIEIWFLCFLPNYMRTLKDAQKIFEKNGNWKLLDLLCFKSKIGQILSWNRHIYTRT